MINIRYRNMEKSELAREIAMERLESITEKFPELNSGRVDVSLEMQNSPVQAGPDQFTVKLHVVSGRYKGITVSKSSPNLYVALADLVEHMLETLNRFGDRIRVKQRRQARKVLQARERPA